MIHLPLFMVIFGSEEKRKVLIVDDDVAIVSLIKDTLANPSYDLVGAHSGFEALQTLHTQKVDMVIVDIMLTEHMNGYELCKQIKEKKETAHIPVLMLSAKKELDDKLHAVYAGADDYMSKPFSTEELAKRVRLNLQLMKQE